MIKLIVSDLDGTLIPEGTQELEKGFLEVLEKLLRQGYLFYTASGRQYANMYQKFLTYADQIGFVCENGALAMEKGKELYLYEVPEEVVREMIKDVGKIPEAELMLSGVHSCYFTPHTEEFRHYMLYELKNDCTIVEDIRTVTQPIIKIAMYVYEFEKNGERIQAYFQEKYGEYADFVTGGNDWIDMIPKHTGKDVALRAVMEQKGLKADEIMVFGDNQNDVSMLQMTPNSYAMANASETVKQHAGHVCESVTETLKGFLKN